MPKCSQVFENRSDSKSQLYLHSVYYCAVRINAISIINVRVNARHKMSRCEVGQWLERRQYDADNVSEHKDETASQPDDEAERCTMRTNQQIYVHKHAGSNNRQHTSVFCFNQFNNVLYYKYYTSIIIFRVCCGKKAANSNYSVHLLSLPIYIFYIFSVCREYHSFKKCKQIDVFSPK